MEMHAGQHSIVHMWGMSFNMDTLYMTWLTFGIILVITFLATRNTKLIPSGVQNMMEALLDALEGQMKAPLGKYFSGVSALLFTFFLFILISNELGLLPSPHILKSPTSDLNTTFALALASTLIVWVVGIKAKGVGYFKHFFQPFAVFVIFNVVEEIAKPVTLAFRLFGNIIAGEIMLELLYNLAPWGPPIIWLGFSLIVGLVQAFVFTILTTSYLGMVVGDNH